MGDENDQIFGIAVDYAITLADYLKMLGLSVECSAELLAELFSAGGKKEGKEKTFFKIFNFAPHAATDSAPDMAVQGYEKATAQELFAFLATKPVLPRGEYSIMAPGSEKPTLRHSGCEWHMLEIFVKAGKPFCTRTEDRICCWRETDLFLGVKRAQSEPEEPEVKP